MTPLLQFKPIYHVRVWGGRGLGSFLGRTVPGSTPIGETWELVDALGWVVEPQKYADAGLHVGYLMR